MCHVAKTDLGDIVWSDGEEVDLVGKALGRLHGGNVGVNENRLHSLFTQSLDCLGNRVTPHTIKHVYMYT